MRGRRPKPTRLKVLTGNPGKRPLNNAEPRPEAAVPNCPDELGETARREWNRLVGELASLKLLTNFDRAALAAYCGAYALWAEATEAIARGEVLYRQHCSGCHGAYDDREGIDTRSRPMPRTCSS